MEENTQENTEENTEENKKDFKKIPICDKSKEIKKYQTRSERRAQLIFQLYNLMNSN